MKPIQQSEETITLPLKRFLFRYLLGSVLDRIKVHPNDAFVIAALDPEEKYVHVQFNSLVGEELEEPSIWLIKEWKTFYLKYQLDKERSERERKEACRNTENTALLLKAMIRETGLTENAAEIFGRVARKNALGKSDEVAKAFGIKFDKGE